MEYFFHCSIVVIVLVLVLLLNNNINELLKKNMVEFDKSYHGQRPPNSGTELSLVSHSGVPSPLVKSWERIFLFCSF